jgi:pimeloyl-ACP methyl ester carboxylesterase
MTSSVFALALAAALASLPPPPTVPGVYRGAVAATDGVRIATFVYVPEQPRPRAPTVVLLPDLGATHLFFDLDAAGLARTLQARGYRVATLDWRGTGLSESPLAAASIEDLALLDVPALLTALGDAREPVVLLGWGFGGSLAYAVAASPQQASRVVGVVALDGVVELDVPNPAVARLLEADGGAVDLTAALGQRAPRGTGDLFELLWLHGSDADRARHLTLLAHGLGVLSEKQTAELRAWMATGQTRLGGPFPEELRQVRCPVLAIQGLVDNWTHAEFASPVRDRLAPEQLTSCMASKLAGFSEDLGHVGLVLGASADREVTPRILEFLAALPSAPPAERR